MDTPQQASVVVTGGRGFIGRAVVKLLQRTGNRVISLDTGAPETARRNDGRVQEALCDITNTSQLQRVFETTRIDGIVHLAAVLPTTARREPGRATQVNIQASQHMLEMGQRFGVRRVVFGSSLSVYGTCPPDQVVSESRRAAPEDLYAAAKLYVEQLGDAYRQTHGLEFVSLRIGRVVGPGAQSVTSAWRSQIFEFLRSPSRAEISLPYIGAERMLLVHVDDVAKMLVALLQASALKHTIYNSVCEGVMVGDLKREVERLNPRISVPLGRSYSSGNPRRLNVKRLREELGVETVPMFEQLRKAAENAKP